MNANLYGLLAASAAAHPAKVALRSSTGSLSYAELDELTGRVAADLRGQGVGPGDRVAIMLPNVAAFAVLYYGVLRAGAVVVPMNPLLREREIEHYLRDPEVSVVYALADLRDVVAPVAERLGTVLHPVVPGEFEAGLSEAAGDETAADRDATDTAVILYTSGTTGRPKGAQLTHGNIGRNVEIGTGMFEMTDADVAIGALPLFHAFGQVCALNSAIARGAELVLIGRFDPAQVLAAMAEHRATMFLGVPTMYGALLHDPSAASTDTSSLRVCVSGGASLPVEILHAFEREFGCTLLEGYGLSETSPMASFNRREHRKPGSIGLPIPGVEMRLVGADGAEVGPGEIGEILIRGHNVMKGYWRMPEETAEAISADGWFRTGDLARRDDEGFYFVVDRLKELVIRGGYNVYPREIEEVLYEHPAVREAAVIGIAHPDLGEEVGAAIALVGPDAATVDELRAFVRDRVAPYKYPRHVWIVDELPKGATNKILKREIAVPEVASQG
ncbi:long-chain-fatty-acid--CoA ligase [Nocardioides sambongensis]|uniref:long-chain-fatty-acid--CoA ligase n=1 Tax=Nocardioides sambongensis TaxID=2589074 RepID=UPI00112B7D35|nr:long-chain fatty acid--CoA ligase [Nocardioides sambongensis]